MDIDELIIKKFDVVCEGELPFKSRGGTRETLAAFMGEVGYGIGAEIGVRKGGYSERLCRNIRGLKLKSIDPWTPFRRNDRRKQESYYQFACSLLAPYGAEVIRKTSVEAARDVPNGSLDFVYIDAMHEFESVMMDILTWAPKVRVGGIVSGHDYTPRSSVCNVTEAVNAYTDAKGIRQWYITDRSVEHRHIPSWFWVKK